MHSIYLDHNATTPLLPEVWEAMRPYFLEHSANPASSHAPGRKARQALEGARERIAELLDASGAKVIFTSGATEANNLAISGLAGPSPGHLLSSPVEHPSIVEPIRHLVSQGFTHTQFSVDQTGAVRVDGDFIRPETRLVTVMLANHELGTVQPIDRLTSVIAGRVPLHCDAAAAAGKMALSFRRLGVTSMTLSAHKFHGPKGIGVLILKGDAAPRPLFWGGHQQHGIRPGTESVGLAVGLAAALELALRDLETKRDRVWRARQLFLTHLRKHAWPVVLNGPEDQGIPHTVNLSFPGCQADVLLMNLDLVGVACSAGSACSSGSLLPSPVVRALGVTPEILQSALRFSFSAYQSLGEVEEAANLISNAVNKLRQRVSTR